MKLFHISDLHIGKLLNGYSLRENQEHVLAQIVSYAASERPDVLLICGDIYDKTAPSGEAYQVFDHFLEELSGIEPGIPVLIIAGNHDSPERLSYASSFLEKHQIHLSVFPPVKAEEHLKKIVLEDEYGPVAFYLLPFLKPGYVRHLFPEGEVTDYESAVRSILSREEIDRRIRNVLLSHQFYAGRSKEPETCESETAVIMAGGLDRIDAGVLDDFDYAALGHLHGAQQAGRNGVRYCGSPYKYSVSEERHHKAVTVVTLGPKGEEPKIDFLPLSGTQDVRRLVGTLQEVLDLAPEGKVCRDFVSVTITDEEEAYRIREKLEERFDHLLELRLDNERTRRRMKEEGEGEVLPVLSPMEAFRQFFEAVHHVPLTSGEVRLMERLIQEAKEEEGL